MEQPDEDSETFTPLSPECLSGPEVQEKLEKAKEKTREIFDR